MCHRKPDGRHMCPAGVPGRWGGEAVATEYVRSSRLFFTRRSIVSDQRQSGGSVREQLGGGLRDGDGGIAAPLRTLDTIAGLPASARLGDGRAWW